MSKTSVVTARIDPATLALADSVATAQGRSRSWFVAEAVRHVAEREAELLAFVKVGIDAANRGEIVPHDQVVFELDEMIAHHRTR